MLQKSSMHVGKIHFKLKNSSCMYDYSIVSCLTHKKCVLDEIPTVSKLEASPNKETLNHKTQHVTIRRILLNFMYMIEFTNTNSQNICCLMTYADDYEEIHHWKKHETKV